MKGRLEFLFYLSVSIGMALATSSFYIFSGLFEVTRLAWILLAIVIAAGFCTVIAHSIGELAGLYPSAPAIRTYFKVAFPDRASLILIYLYLLFLVILAGVEAYIFALVLQALFPVLTPMVTVLALLLTVIGINLLGLELPRGTQMVATLALLLIIVAVGILGLAGAQRDAVAALSPGPIGSNLAVLPAAIGLAVFLFTGFEWVTPVGLRPSAYERKIPLTMPVALLCLTATYGFFALGLAANLPSERIATALAPHVPYLEELLGTGGRYLAGVLSIFATYSTFNAGVLGGSRLVYALAREGVLPNWVAMLGLRTGAPIGGVLLLGGGAIVSSVLIVTFRLQLLGAVIGAAIVCLIYAAYMIAVFRMRGLAPERSRPYRTPIPASVQRLVVVLLLAISVSTLFSLPGEAVRATVGMALCVVAAILLTEWSLRRRTAVELTGPPRLPPRS